MRDNDMPKRAYKRKEKVASVASVASLASVNLNVDTISDAQHFSDIASQLRDSARNDVNITPKSSLTYHAFYACLDLISSDLASCSFPVYKRTANGRERDYEHPVDGFLNFEPNEYTDSYTFRKTLIKDRLQFGNAFAEIEFSTGGKVIGLHYISPQQMSAEFVKRNDRTTIEYRWKGKTLPAESVLHLRGLSDDTLMGMSPLQMFKVVLSSGIAAEKFANDFFVAGGVPEGFLTLGGGGNDKTRAELKEKFNKRNGIPVLGEGTEWHPIQAQMDETQLLESRKFNPLIICSLLKVPPTKMAILQGELSTNALLSLNTSYVQNCLRPLAHEIEREFCRKLIPKNLRLQVMCEHNLSSMMRGDDLTQNQILQIQRNCGVINANEFRELMNKNHLPGDLGEDYLITAGMMTLDKARTTNPSSSPAPITEPDQPASPEKKEEKEEKNNKAIAAAKTVLSSTLLRCARREQNAISKAATKGVEHLETYAIKFYEDYKSLLVESITPIVNCLSAITGGEIDIDAMVNSLIDSSLDELAMLTESKATSEDIVVDVNSWCEKLNGKYFACVNSI